MPLEFLFSKCMSSPTHSDSNCPLLSFVVWFDQKKGAATAQRLDSRSYLRQPILANHWYERLKDSWSIWCVWMCLNCSMQVVCVATSTRFTPRLAAKKDGHSEVWLLAVNCKDIRVAGAVGIGWSVIQTTWTWSTRSKSQQLQVLHSMTMRARLTVWMLVWCMKLRGNTFSSKQPETQWKYTSNGLQPN